MEQAFRKSGEEAKADQIYLAMRAIEREEQWRHRQFLGFASDTLELVSANYGVRPFRLFAYALLAILAGVIIFSRPNSVVASKNSSVNTNLSAALAWQDALGVSIHQFLPIDVPMGSEWTPSPFPIQTPLWVGPKRFEVRLRPAFFATVIIRVPGWILVTLGVASLTGVLRRIGPK